MITLTTFATGLRAMSLVEDLSIAGIQARYVQPKWENKRLPPPRAQVQVKKADLPAAERVLNVFNQN